MDRYDSEHGTDVLPGTNAMDKQGSFTPYLSQWLKPIDFDYRSSAKVVYVIHLCDLVYFAEISIFKITCIRTK